jgi:REP element-mobilizing transposase RayT
MKESQSSVYRRRSIRLKEYNYSGAGYYYITICTKDKIKLFGEIKNGEMILNESGKIVKKCWLAIPQHYPCVVLHEYIVMPNHIHGIIEITDKNCFVGAQNFVPEKQNQFQKIVSKSIGSIIRGFKIGVTKWFRTNTDVYDVWQRNYYEHIIRDETSYFKIAEYIIANPLKWSDDRYYY